MNSILKKSLSFIMVFCMMLFTFAFAASVSAADQTYTHTFSAKTWTAQGDKTLSGITWTMSGTKKASDYFGYEATRGQQFGSGSNPYTAMTLSTTYFNGTYNIKTIKINTSGASSIAGSFTVTIGGTQIGNKTTLTKTATEYTFNAGGVTGDLAFNYTQTSSKAFYVKSITVEYEQIATDEPAISIAAGNSYVIVGDEISFTATTQNLDGVDLEWVSSNEEVATIVEGTLTGLAMGTTTVKAVAGEVESNEIQVLVYPSNENPITIAEALEVCEMTDSSNSPLQYTVVGTIKEIDSEGYSEQYNNITVVVTDGTNDITAYRMKGGSDLAVGDKVAVTGNLVIAYSTKEFATGCTYVEYATISFMDGNEEYYSYETTVGADLVLPAEPTKEGFNFMGWYEDPEEGLEYDTTLPVSGNLTLTAKWASTALEVFDVTFDANGGTGEYEAQQVVEGDKVVAVADPVKQYATFLGWYNGDTKFDLENDVVTANMTLTAKWEEWADSVVEFVEKETLATLNLSYTTDNAGTVSTESVLDFSTDAARVSQDADSQVWSANGITFTNNKASATSDVVNNVGPIRCYKNSTITIAASQMTKIVFSTSTSSSYTIKGTETVSVAYTEFTSANGTTTLVFSEPVDSVTITLSANQVRINNITVYSENSGTSYSFSNVAMRFQGALDVATYDALVAEGAEVKFGVVAAKVSKLNGQTLLEAVEAEDVNAKFFECQPELTQEGDTYLFALLLTNVPETDFAQEVVAAAYVEVDGVKYYMSTKQFSVNSLAQYYVDNLAADEAIAPHLEALKALAKAN